MNKTGLPRGLVIGGLIIFVIIALLVGYFYNNESSLGTGPEYSAPNSPAIMNKSQDLYKVLNNDTQFGLLRTDLGNFARAKMDAYKNGKNNPPVFAVNTKPVKKGQIITFEGKYKASKDTIAVSITKLPNNRIKLSVVNKKKNDSSYNSQLTSNNKRNQVIETMPINESDFSINYDQSSDTFIINLYEGTNDALTKAGAELAAKLGVPDISKEKVTFMRSLGN